MICVDIIIKISLNLFFLLSIIKNNVKAIGNILKFKIEQIIASIMLNFPLFLSLFHKTKNIAVTISSTLPHRPNSKLTIINIMEVIKKISFPNFLEVRNI